MTTPNNTITISGEEYWLLQKKAEACGLSVEEYIEKIVIEDMMKAAEEAVGEAAEEELSGNPDEILITDRFTRKQINQICALLSMDDVTFGDLISLLTELRRNYDDEKKAGKKKVDYLREGDELKKRLVALQEKYLDYVWNGSTYTGTCRLEYKDGLLEYIEGYLREIQKMIQFFSKPDYTLAAETELNDEEKRVWYEQKTLMSGCEPKTTYKEIQTRALYAYRHLELDYQMFKEDVESTPEEVFLALE
ncbi:MAG: hypothetical protein MJ005_03465 [Methanocorpusculum sp.]|nr:hypothetical protein [Methanocorpusculum sp.]